MFFCGKLCLFFLDILVPRFLVWAQEISIFDVRVPPPRHISNPGGGGSTSIVWGCQMWGFFFTKLSCLQRICIHFQKSPPPCSQPKLPQLVMKTLHNISQWKLTTKHNTVRKLDGKQASAFSLDKNERNQKWWETIQFSVIFSRTLSCPLRGACSRAVNFQRKIIGIWHMVNFGICFVMKNCKKRHREDHFDHFFCKFVLPGVVQKLTTLANTPPQIPKYSPPP